MRDGTYEVIDVDAPVRRNETELRLTLTGCRSSTLQRIIADLSNAAGTAAHKIASIFAIIGGATFVIVAIPALWRASPGRSTA
jgi:hypothetical protein